jgi:hypothetical protein
MFNILMSLICTTQAGDRWNGIMIFTPYLIVGYPCSGLRGGIKAQFKTCISARFLLTTFPTTIMKLIVIDVAVVILLAASAIPPNVSIIIQLFKNVG